MNEFTRSLLYIALLVCVPIVTACIQKGIAVFIEFIVAKTNDIKVQRLVREIGSAVSNAVAAMNQTYVNDLKTAGTFKEAEQKEITRSDSLEDIVEKITYKNIMSLEDTKNLLDTETLEKSVDLVRGARMVLLF